MTDMPVPLKITKEDINAAVMTLVEAANANGDYYEADNKTRDAENEALEALDILLCAAFRELGLNG